MPKKILIMVVDDEQDVVQLLSLRLQSAGYETAAAFDTLQAKRLVLQTKPDLVLLDIMIPAGGGLDVLNSMRKNVNTYNTPVIIITGLSDSKTKEEAEKLGISAYFVKPLDSVVLMQKIAELLNKA